MLSLTMKKDEIKTRLVRREPNYCLVVDFENSVPPLVWHLDLEKTGTFTLSLRGSGDDWTLGIVESKGEFEVVARFDGREDAEDAFEAVQKALMGRPANRGGHPWRFFLILLIALATLFMASSLYSKREGVQTPLSGEAPPIAGPSVPRPGVPMSADDVLGGR